MKRIDDGNIKFFRVAQLGDFPKGERLFVEIEGLPIVIFSIGDEFLATGDICSHDGAAIGDGEMDGEEITCPRHGARFNVKTGKAISLPAVVDIPIYPVRIKDGYVEVGLSQK